MKTSTAVLLIVTGLVACAGVGERADSTKVLPVEDMNARDTTAPPPPPRVTRLSIMDSLPSGGECSVTRYAAKADQAREVRYATSAPSRTYVLEVGRPPRRFPPVSLDIRGTEVGADITETENVYVGFSASGSVSVGTRRYTATGRITANDREPLRASDSATVLAFVKQILDRCDR